LYGADDVIIIIDRLPGCSKDRIVNACQSLVNHLFGKRHGPDGRGKSGAQGIWILSLFADSFSDVGRRCMGREWKIENPHKLKGNEPHGTDIKGDLLRPCFIFMRHVAQLPFSLLMLRLKKCKKPAADCPLTILT
jgi:hypothetical protein